MAKNRHAVILGRKGGKKKSARKARAARENGKLGGDPRKIRQVPVVEALPEHLRNELHIPPVGVYVSLNDLVKAKQGHDVKACRIYRCLQCKALGHKDRNRGLL